MTSLGGGSRATKVLMLYYQEAYDVKRDVTNVCSHLSVFETACLLGLSVIRGEDWGVNDYYFGHNPLYLLQTSNSTTFWIPFQEEEGLANITRIDNKIHEEKEKVKIKICVTQMILKAFANNKQIYQISLNFVFARLLIFTVSLFHRNQL